MTDVLLLVAGALALAVVVAFPTGRYLHRLAHRADSVDPRDCPPWCVRQRAAALNARPARRGAHRASRRRAPCRIRHLLQLTAERKSR